MESRILSIACRVAAHYTKGADLGHFMDRDFTEAVNGIQHLIDQLQKTAETLNPQDESRAVIERSITDFNGLRDQIRSQAIGLKKIAI